MFQDLIDKRKKISVIGLGYVGLPLALEFARHFSVIGFDINESRIQLMKSGVDPSGELNAEAFVDRDILFTSDPAFVKQAHFHIVAVPTDINKQKIPDLNPLLSASATVARALKKGDYVIYESTVYPGCTEEDCLPILERDSSLQLGVDFKLGYSPERINPGDKVRTLTTILKIISGSDPVALNEIEKIYGHIIKAGLYKAPNIKVAEAAKVIENTQRDLNISLMNELSIIFDKIGIDTNEVLKAAGTKWNFLKFYPGLVGGHCISVDPYYLLYKSKKLGYEPEVIAAGRKVNDFMPSFIAKKMVQKLIAAGKNPGNCKVLIEGVTFKENVSDIRNSKVVDLAKELMSYSINVHVTDPFADPNILAKEYNVSLLDNSSSNYDAIIVAVAHDQFREYTRDYFLSKCNDHPVLFDLKGLYTEIEGFDYWRL